MDENLTKHIKKIYNTVENSALTSDKKIYKAKQLPYTGEEFIVLENNMIYLSTNLSDRILEGTYIVNANNEIEYDILNENKDYEFYNSSILRLEEFEGEKVIVIENNELNQQAFYQQVY